MCHLSDDSSLGSGIRINKCFKSFASRRAADRMVEEGRVHINGILATAGTRVFSGDQVQLDGKHIEWERLTVTAPAETKPFTYLKLWKPVGVVCTTDLKDKNSIMHHMRSAEIASGDRLFPVGRLDSASSGLILLTSDGRLPSAALGSRSGCTKEYLVTVDVPVCEKDLLKLRQGVVITTVAQRDRVRRPLTAMTSPCEVERIGRRQLKFVLKEGRNRQIRKMLGALNYTTLALHRNSFMGITLDPLKYEGEWKDLNKREMDIVRDCLHRYNTRNPIP